MTCCCCIVDPCLGHALQCKSLYAMQPSEARVLKVVFDAANRCHGIRVPSLDSVATAMTYWTENALMVVSRVLKGAVQGGQEHLQKRKDRSSQSICGDPKVARVEQEDGCDAHIPGQHIQAEPLVCRRLQTVMLCRILQPHRVFPIRRWQQQGEE